MENLKKKTLEIQPTVRIGKSGLTEQIVREILNQLRARGLIKVKMLRAALDKESRIELARKIEERTGAMVVSHVGSIVTLSKKRNVFIDKGTRNKV